MMIKRAIILVLLISAYGCNTVKNKITVKLRPSDDNIILRFAKKSINDPILVQIPNYIVITNNSSKNIFFYQIKYKYNKLPSNRNYRIELFQHNKKISNDKKKVVLANDSIVFKYYSRHYLDSSFSGIKQFKSYVPNKPLKLHFDSVQIGKVEAFKKKNRILFEKLTKGDSITIQFFENKNIDTFIKIPVTY